MSKKYKLKKKTIEVTKIITHHHPLTASDRVTYSYSYKKDRNNTILEVVNVSYEVEIDDEWITILRFDSTHGKMHCHMRISLQNPEEVVVPGGWIARKGTPKNWLSWAMKDIRKKYLNYRKGFFKRSGIKNLY